MNTSTMYSHMLLNSALWYSVKNKGKTLSDGTDTEESVRNMLTKYCGDLDYNHNLSLQENLDCAVEIFQMRTYDFHSRKMFNAIRDGNTDTLGMPESWCVGYTAHQDGFYTVTLSDLLRSELNEVHSIMSVIYCFVDFQRYYDTIMDNVIYPKRCDRHGGYSVLRKEFPDGLCGKDVARGFDILKEFYRIN